MFARERAGRLIGFVVAAVAAEAGRVYGVAAREGEATFEELVAQLKNGTLSPSGDLVWSDGGWCPFERAREFYEACDGVVDRRKRYNNLRSALYLIGSVVVGIAMFWVVVFVGR